MGFLNRLNRMTRPWGAEEWRSNFCHLGRMCSTNDNKKWGSWLKSINHQNVWRVGIFFWEVYIPRTQMTLVLIGKGLVLGGWPSEIEVIWVPGSQTDDIGMKLIWSLPVKMEASLLGNGCRSATWNGIERLKTMSFIWPYMRLANFFDMKPSDLQGFPVSTLNFFDLPSRLKKFHCFFLLKDSVVVFSPLLKLGTVSNCQKKGDRF